ncbi:hypothetical protein CaCOL14_003777 [Colletotrichum acutatum]|uniref:Uncharacterized protein n=1 Tax=Glomerella acutata TaxID=27357 RepID=A0AAD8XIH3_GLOAC|nr:uncharacterized protein BDZ83DRAFT_617112 [Colletotrichum acutatum]KAK1726073.1 hypothetical protein BDZ83DRAFT_617112 [Colletotrichum acutatum]
MKSITFLAGILLVSVGPSLINADTILGPRPTTTAVAEDSSLANIPPMVILEIIKKRKGKGNKTTTAEVRETTNPAKRPPSLPIIIETHYEVIKPKTPKTAALEAYSPQPTAPLQARKQRSDEADEKTGFSFLCTHNKCPKEMEVPRTLEPRQQQEADDVEPSADDEDADSYRDCPKRRSRKAKLSSMAATKTLEPRQLVVETAAAGPSAGEDADSYLCTHEDCPHKLARLVKPWATKTLDPRQPVVPTSTAVPFADEKEGAEEMDDEYYAMPPPRTRRLRCKGRHSRTASSTATPTSSTTSSTTSSAISSSTGTVTVTVTPTVTSSSSSPSTTTSTSSSTSSSTSTTAPDGAVTRTTTVTVTADPTYTPTYLLKPYPTTFRKVRA